MKRWNFSSVSSMLILTYSDPTPKWIPPLVKILFFLKNPSQSSIPIPFSHFNQANAARDLKWKETKWNDEEKNERRKNENLNLRKKRTVAENGGFTWLWLETTATERTGPGRESGETEEFAFVNCISQLIPSLLQKIITKFKQVVLRFPWIVVVLLLLYAIRHGV